MPIQDPDAALETWANAWREAGDIVSSGAESVSKWLNDARVSTRDTLAYAIHNPGQGAEGDPGAHALHEQWMRGAANDLSGTLRPGATRAVLGAVGAGNEALSGSLAWLAGRGFYGPTGYDPEDMAANRRGIEAGIRDSEQPGTLGDMVMLGKR